MEKVLKTIENLKKNFRLKDKATQKYAELLDKRQCWNSSVKEVYNINKLQEYKFRNVETQEMCVIMLDPSLTGVLSIPHADGNNDQQYGFFLKQSYLEAKTKKK